jgi:hypothetical protein
MPHNAEGEGRKSSGKGREQIMIAIQPQTGRWRFRFLIILFLSWVPIISAQSSTSPEQRLQVGAEPSHPSAGFNWGEVNAAVIGGFVGGIFGVWGALAAVRKAEKLTVKREDERAKTLREMISSEIKYNLQALQDDRVRVKESNDKYDGFKSLSLHPVPVWSTVAWQQSVASLARALNKEELLSVQRFYASLASLTEARNALTMLYRENPTPQAFAEQLVGRVWQLTAELQHIQNPLESR